MFHTFFKYHDMIIQKAGKPTTTLNNSIDIMKCQVIIIKLQLSVYLHIRNYQLCKFPI